jgi:CxxC motif-containing protein (DUF1111 family)
MMTSRKDRDGTGVRKLATFAVHGSFSLVVAGAIAAGCSGGAGPAGSGSTESVGSVAEPLTTTISGTITDSIGRPLTGVTVALNGAEQATATTGLTGTYSFPINVPGTTASFSVQPTKGGCTFSPSVANLNGVSGSTTANFTGTGTTCIGVAQATAVDPGPRGGTRGAGAPPTAQPDDPDNSAAQAAAAVACLSTRSNTTPAPGLSSTLLLACEQAIIRFQEIDSVSGTIPGEPGVGLGPTFNGNSCAMCHAEPGVMGSSPGLNSALDPIPNPQIALATLDGATNVIPSFITAAGPVREGRLGLVLSTGKPDGGVHGLFTIAGRSDAQGCEATQPDFATELASNNVTFRIPTPTFGGGLIENVLETTLEANLNAAPTGAPTSASLGISGLLNRAGNDGTTTRFGWKAQNKSLMIFAGEAYNVEQGVSNLNFPNEREGGAGNLAGCFNINPTPEDNTNFSATSGTVSDVSSDLLNFALAMQLSAPPTPAVAPFTIGTTTITAAEVATGQSEFVSIGCANCHTPSLTTAKSSFDAALSNVTFHPFSDIAVHHMGTVLSDGVSQGLAVGDQFRSAPLWGVGQRLFFLHDGRTSNIVTAIEAHAGSGSEANAVITNFNTLNTVNQQAIVDFLRSL